MADQLPLTVKVDFFKFKELLYTKNSDFAKLTAKQKYDNAFMMNRNIAIAYPQIAQAFNKLGMDSAMVMNAYHCELSSNQQPRWSFISGKKVEKQNVNATLAAINKLDKKVLELYMTANDIDSKTFDILVKCHADELLVELQEFATQVK